LSVAAIPKPSGLRPPFGGGPPIRTTFDGHSSGEPDPEIRRLTDSVNRLLASVDGTPGDRLDVLLRLLEQRKRWVEEELTVERLLCDDTLPPFEAFSLEYLLEPSSREESVYVRLLNQLDHAIFRVQRKIAALNGESATSDS
jgi:hypothetical protein